MGRIITFLYGTGLAFASICCMTGALLTSYLSPPMFEVTEPYAVIVLISKALITFALVILAGVLAYLHITRAEKTYANDVTQKPHNHNTGADTRYKQSLLAS